MTKPLSRKDFRRAQRWGVKRIYNNEATILAWDMGSGKTVTALTAADDLLEDREVRKVLVVAPLNVACATFPDEIEEWVHLRHIDYTLIRAEDDDKDIGRARDAAYRFARDVIGLDPKEAQRFAGKKKTAAKEWKRRRLAREKSELHIINREALPWLWEFFGKKWPYDMVIVDEASMFKNGVRRTELKKPSQFGAMAKARKFVKRIVLMTGTPAPKGVQNLWGLAYIADLGERLGTSRTKFEKRWFESDHMGWNLTPRPNAVEDITERLSDIMFTLDEDDYPELPPLIKRQTRVKLPKRVLEEYHRFEKTMISQTYDVEAVNNGVLAGKLLQFANGSMYQEDGSDVWIHDEKLHALEEIIEEANGEPVLVAYSYKFDLQRILKRYKKAVVFGKGDVREQKRLWNKGKIDLLLAHPASVGHGQNIQFGGNIAVWYGLTPDLELYLQFLKRLHRPGQTRTVYMNHIIARGTYDEKLLPLLSDKEATQDSIMEPLHIKWDSLTER